MRAAIASAIVILGLGLSGCVAYDVASTAVDVSGNAADAAGDVIGASFSQGGKNTSD